MSDVTLMFLRCSLVLSIFIPFVLLNLHVPDFTTSARLTEGINKLLGDGTAQSVDGVSVKVAAPAADEAVTEAKVVEKPAKTAKPVKAAKAPKAKAAVKKA